MADRVGVDLEGVGRLGQAPEAEARMAARVVAVVELGGVAVGDPLRQAAAVLLRAGRLGDQLVPVVGIGRQDPPVAHDERDAGRVQAVLQELERPPQVALPAVGVAGEEQVERAGRAPRRASRSSSPSARRCVPLWATWNTSPVSTRPWRSMKRSCCSRWLAGP